MLNPARAFVRASSALLIVLGAAAPGRAADVTIVVVPQGMILETQLTRAGASLAAIGTHVGFVVTHDLRVDDHVVIAAGSSGVAHLVRKSRGDRAATTSRVAYDYVVASDGTRIPVAGSLPYLTTRASRSVVIYDSNDDELAAPAVPPAPADESLARP